MENRCLLPGRRKAPVNLGPAVIQRSDATTSPRVGLTRRELEIARRLPESLTYAEIGRALGIKTETVKSHIVSIYSKLGVRHRHTAVHQLWLNDLLPRAGD